MSKQAMRDETERLVKEALERKNLTVKQGKTRIDSKCRKCGALNRVSAAHGQVRVSTRRMKIANPHQVIRGGLLLAQSGRPTVAGECPLLGVKRTSLLPAVDQHTFENLLQICEGVCACPRRTNFGGRGWGRAPWKNSSEAPTCGSKCG
jgi:hypothetical protein